MNAITNLSPAQLRRAADIKERIDALQDQLSTLLGSEVPTPEATEAPTRKKISAAGRAKMRAAAKARWAKIKETAPSAKPVKKAKRKFSAQALANIRAGVAKRLAAKGKATSKPAKKAKKTFSAAHKAALVAAAKARWAKINAEKKTNV